MDPGLRFWLRYIEREGGLAEPVPDGDLVLLTPALAAEFELPAELTVTSDPDAAREDGLTFLASGHPAPARAADLVLAQGDTGIVALTPPTSVPPGPGVLLDKARDQFPVDHGRIDPAGSPVPTVRPVLRAGVLISYALSAEDHFQERAECWLDVASRLAFPDAWVAKLVRLAPADPRAGLPADVEKAVAEAHQILDAAARVRRGALGDQVKTAFAQERQRARDYYAEQISSMENRLRAAEADRAEALRARLAATRQERERRLAEIAEKYQAHHEIRPYRLHVVQVPAIRLPVDVLRGSRRYPLVLEYLTPIGSFAPLRCPSCDRPEPLVASKTKLGCQSCLPKPVPQAPPSPPPPAPPPPPEATKPGPAAPAASGAPARVPPPAVQPPKVLPPKAKAKATRLAGEKLARDLWQAAGARSPTIGRLALPDSPAATLLRLYGPGGPGLVLGMEERPVGCTAVACRSEQDRPEAVSGHVRDGVYLFSFQITWRYDGTSARAEEILPNPFTDPGHRFHPHWMTLTAVGRPTGRLPAPPGLDPVERLIWRHSLPYCGLPLVLRMLTAWHRIPDQTTILQAHPHKAVAAAIDRMIGYRSGDRGLYGEAADLYKVAEDTVRAADKALARRLKLSAAQPW